MKANIKLVLIVGILGILGFIPLHYYIQNLPKCPLKDIDDGEICNLINSFEGYCERTGKTTFAMNLNNCVCNDNRQLICLEDLEDNQHTSRASKVRD